MEAITLPSGEFTNVGGGFLSACAVSSDNQLFCWWIKGDLPVPDGEYLYVGGGYHHTCAVQTDGIVACWGDNDYGQSSPP